MKDERWRRLDALVERQTRELLDEAVLTDGSVPRPRLETLVDLRTLAEMKPRQAPPSHRWIPALVMVLTLLLMSGLLFIRVPSTEIELEIRATEVGFRVPTLQPLTEGISRAPRRGRSSVGSGWQATTVTPRRFSSWTRGMRASCV
jgi:hypothetical protein